MLHASESETAPPFGRIPSKRLDARIPQATWPTRLLCGFCISSVLLPGKLHPLRRANREWAASRGAYLESLTGFPGRIQTHLIGEVVAASPHQPVNVFFPADMRSNFPHPCLGRLNGRPAHSPRRRKLQERLRQQLLQRLGQRHL